MTSKAFSGVGTEFKRADADSSATTFTKIAEVNNITGPNKSRETIDVTNFDSPGGYREFITSFRDGGEVTIEMNFTRDGYVLMNNDFESDTAREYQIVLPDTGNTTLEFSAFVTNLGMAIPLDDKVSAPVTLKITGQVTLSS